MKTQHCVISYFAWNSWGHILKKFIQPLHYDAYYWLVNHFCLSIFFQVFLYPLLSLWATVILIMVCTVQDLLLPLCQSFSLPTSWLYYCDCCMAFCFQSSIAAHFFHPPTCKTHFFICIYQNSEDVTCHPFSSLLYYFGTWSVDYLLFVSSIVRFIHPVAHSLSLEKMGLSLKGSFWYHFSA